MQNRSNKPRIGITMGDPAGIGPEIIQKVFKKYDIFKFCDPIVFGTKRVLLKEIPLFDINANFILGKPTKESGKASLDYINAAIDQVKNKKIDAIVTCPINKKTISESLPGFVGHTDYLADKFNIKEYAMMFYHENIKVVLLTTHIPLSEISKHITKQNILSKLSLINSYFAKSQIAVLGANPHAGERGILGAEEEVIISAIEEAKKNKIDAYGPFASDSFFAKQYKKYDYVLAMYHDQGLIPVKMLTFNEAVNVTLGLPFVRTSVDHGCGYDIVGKGIANERSLFKAIRLVSKIQNSKFK